MTKIVLVSNIVIVIIHLLQPQDRLVLKRKFTYNN